MPRWPLVAALLLATAGGTALVTTQLVQGDPASQGDAGSDEDTAASAEAMAARAEIADDPIAPKRPPPSAAPTGEWHAVYPQRR